MQFVASFLGRERGLRRLALRTVADITPIAGPSVSPEASPSAAIEVMDRFGTSWVAIVEVETLHGWLSRKVVEGALEGAGAIGSTVGELPLRPFGSRVSPTTPLREALDVIVNARSRMAAVIERDGERDRYLGMITIDEVAGGLES